MSSHLETDASNVTSVIVYQTKEERCFVCDKWFRGKAVRDQHLIIHLNSVSTAIMENVDQLPCVTSGALVPNQCPLCASVMGTRKSLRHHLLLRHVLRERGALHTLLGAKRARGDECALVQKLVRAFQIHRKISPKSEINYLSINKPIAKSLQVDNKIIRTTRAIKVLPMWMRLRAFVLAACRHDDVQFSCSLCAQTNEFSSASHFELHVVLNHLHVAQDIWHML